MVRIRFENMRYVRARVRACVCVCVCVIFVITDKRLIYLKAASFQKTPDEELVFALI